MKILTSSALFLLCGSALAANVTLQFETETLGSSDARAWEESSMKVLSTYDSSYGMEEYEFVGSDFSVGSSSFSTSGNSYRGVGTVSPPFGSYRSYSNIHIVSGDTSFGYSYGYSDGSSTDGLYWGTSADFNEDRSPIYGSAFDMLSMDFCGTFIVLAGCSLLPGQAPPESGSPGDSLVAAIALIGVKSDGSMVSGGWSNQPGTNTLIFDSSWNDLVRVSLYSGLVEANFGDIYAPLEIEVDNIVVNAVPVPAAVWLFGSALAGLGWLRRKHAA